MLNLSKPNLLLRTIWRSISSSTPSNRQWQGTPISENLTEIKLLNSLKVKAYLATLLLRCRRRKKPKPWKLAQAAILSSRPQIALEQRKWAHVHHKLRVKSHLKALSHLIQISGICLATSWMLEHLSISWIPETMSMSRWRSAFWRIGSTPSIPEQDAKWLSTRLSFSNSRVNMVRLSLMPA